MTRVRSVGAPAFERYPDASAAGSPEEEGPLFACGAHADALVSRPVHSQRRLNRPLTRGSFLRSFQMFRPALTVLLTCLLVTCAFDSVQAAEREDVRKAINLVTSVKMPYPENLTRNRARTERVWLDRDGATTGCIRLETSARRPKLKRSIDTRLLHTSQSSSRAAPNAAINSERISRRCMMRVSKSPSSTSANSAFACRGCLRPLERAERGTCVKP
jgi:hypothetical protein